MPRTANPLSKMTKRALRRQKRQHFQDSTAPEQLFRPFRDLRFGQLLDDLGE